jgi:hypothetical protein
MYSGLRLRYLRHFQAHTSFLSLRCTEIDLEAFPCRESRDELRVKDENFTKQIKRVFKTLKTVENHTHGTRKIELVLPTPFRWVDEVFGRHRVSSAWRVHLLRPQELPELSSVHSFSICNPEDISYKNYIPWHTGPFWSLSRLDRRVLIDIASRLPNLQYLGRQLGIMKGKLTDEKPARKHFEHDNEACARDSRQDFAKALESTKLPESLKYVQLDFLTNIRQNMNEEREEHPTSSPARSYTTFSVITCAYSPQTFAAWISASWPTLQRSGLIMAACHSRI